MKEAWKGEKKRGAISKALICMISLLMVLCFIPTDVHGADNPPFLLKVNGVDILKAQDNTVECGGGTAKYDGATNTLTLKNAAIHRNDTIKAIDCQGGGLTINLIGTNTIKTESSKGIYAVTYSRDLKFTGSGTLTIDASSEGIQGDQSNIVVDGCSVNIANSQYGGITAWGGTLTIKNGATVTVNGTALSIVGENGITVTDSNVEATASGDNTNVFHSRNGTINISKSVVKATETAEKPYPTIWGKAIKISNSSDVTVSTTGNNAIYSPGTLSVTDSSLKADSPDFPIWCEDSVTISGGMIKSVDTGGDYVEPAIHTGKTLAIMNGADVIADGGITAIEGMTVTPVNGGLVEFKAGIQENGEAGAKHKGKSPYDEEFSFSHGDIELGYTYIHIKNHIHADDKTGWHSDENSHWNTCECGTILNKASHTFKWVVEKEATYTEKGSRHEECSVCEYKKASEEIPVISSANKDTPNNDNGSAETGDQTNVGLFAALLTMSALSIVILTVRKKKRA